MKWLERGCMTWYLYSHDSVDTIHMIQAANYFSDQSIQTRTQATTCDNTSVHILWFKIYLKHIQSLPSFHRIRGFSKKKRREILQTFCLGPARRKWIPLGLFLCTTIYKKKAKWNQKLRNIVQEYYVSKIKPKYLPVEQQYRPRLQSTAWWEKGINFIISSFMAIDQRKSAEWEE